MSSSSETASRSRQTRLWACGGFLGTFLIGCCLLAAFSLLLRNSRPTARDLYSGAPDLAAGQDVSQALVDAGVKGATVLVIPIKDSVGQIAIITLDESQGYAGFGTPGVDSLKIVVGNIVTANRQGNLAIEQLSIDYRDETGSRAMAFTTTMDRAEAFADGRITQQQFVGEVDFNLVDTLRHYGLDQLLGGQVQP